MRWDSPFSLALAGTVAIHLIIITVADALVVTHPFIPPKPAPHVELVDLALPPPPKPELPPPPKPDEPKPDPAETKQEQPVVKQTATKTVARAQPQVQEEQPVEEPKTETPPTNDPGGGDPPMLVDDGDIAAQADAIIDKDHKKKSGIGRGGSGGGTGSGSGKGAGSGSGGEAPEAVSVAKIKRFAKPKGDFSYFDAKKDYPAEAKQLGIEGVIQVELRVDERGHVRQVTLLNRLGHGLDELAVARSHKLEFEPAVDMDDRPIVSSVVWTFEMTLPK